MVHKPVIYFSHIKGFGGSCKSWTNRECNIILFAFIYLLSCKIPI